MRGRKYAISVRWSAEPCSYALSPKNDIISTFCKFLCACCLFFFLLQTSLCLFMRGYCRLKPHLSIDWSHWRFLQPRSSTWNKRDQSRLLNCTSLAFSMESYLGCVVRVGLSWVGVTISSESSAVGERDGGRGGEAESPTKNGSEPACIKSSATKMIMTPSNVLTTWCLFQWRCPFTLGELVDAPRPAVGILKKVITFFT